MGQIFPWKILVSRTFFRRIPYFKLFQGAEAYSEPCKTSKKELKD